MNRKSFRQIAFLSFTVLVLLAPAFLLAESETTPDWPLSDINLALREYYAKGGIPERNFVEYKTETHQAPVRDDNYVSEPLTADYRLVETVDETQVLKDSTGAVVWSRQVTNCPQLYYSPHDITFGYTLISSAENPEFAYNELRYPSSVINRHGTLPIKNPDKKTWMLIDRNGKETLLPEYSAGFSPVGFIFDKYWLFTNAMLGYDYRDYEFYSGDEVQISPFPDDLYGEIYGEGYEPFKDGYCLFREDGSLLAKAYVPDSLYLKKIFFTQDMSKVIYFCQSSPEDYGLRKQLLVHANLDGSIIWKKADVPADNIRWLRFTDDGQFALYINDQGIFLLSLADGHIIRKIQTVDYDEYTIASFNGKYLLTRAYNNNQNKLLIYDCLADKVIFALPTQNAYQYFLSGDGNEFYYSEDDYRSNTLTKHYFRIDEQLGGVK